jgi:hypothetical protein
LSSNPRYNEIGFINSYLYKNHEAEIKITKHYYFMLLGLNHRTRVKKLLAYERKYLNHMAGQDRRAWESGFW